MQVFVHSLPDQGNLNERSLHAQLLQFMRALQISDASWIFDKPVKKRHGFITFLYEQDARRFLFVHGETMKPNSRRPEARLDILGAKVFCKLSDRAPSAIALNALRYRVERAQQPRQQRPQPPPPPPPGEHLSSSFQCFSMSCGYYRFINKRLAFVPEQRLEHTDLMRFSKRYISIEFLGRTAIHIPFSTIHEIVWSPRGTITLTLTTVPLIHSPPSANDGTKKRMTALNRSHAEVIGMCLIYQFDVDPRSIHRRMNRLHDLGSLTVSSHDLLTGSGPEFSASLAHLKNVLYHATQRNLMPFSLLLQLQALAYNAYLPPDTVAGLAKALCDVYERTPISLETMKYLLHAIDWPSPDHPDPSQFEVPELLKFLLETELSIESADLLDRTGLTNPGQNLTHIHRVVVTPTHMTLHGPELENKNRVLRKFPNHIDHFIRVQFCDEDGQRLNFNGRLDYSDVYSRFLEIMVNGIQVAGRTYSFLGWSHSSLRAHSMWFVAPFIDDNGNLQTHFSIISNLGRFEDIQSPARCAARIGQAFSETPFAIPLKLNGIDVEHIPDVKSDDCTRVFSDGVGTISRKAIEAIVKDLPPRKRKPTCFQIRWAGAKGMVALDPRLTSTRMRLRPSMIKFESGEKYNLEICDMASKPIELYLNRQMIKILEDMGVPQDWFVDLQNDELKELRLIASTAYNMANFIRTRSVGKAMKLYRLLLLADNLDLDYRSDPFLRRATNAVMLRELRLLKHKAHIFVPHGITLFGIMDETGYLNEGEVYVTYETKSGPKAKRYQPPPLHNRLLLVTRSPALHPGDIQWAANVVPPAGHYLRELRNCIVFSSRGKRDLPSQLSGGDLDGDIFNVIWDPKVTNLTSIKTYVPANYPRVPPASIGRVVTTEDIARFFIDFMRTDQLGTIATRHMVLADLYDEGTLAESCIMAAELHSTAVDFSKTGVPANIKSLPRVGRYRPDFLAPGPNVRIHSRADIESDQFLEEEDNDETHELDPPGFKYYLSKKVLGVLYRAVDEHKIWKDTIQQPPSKDGTGLSFYGAFLNWATDECNALGVYRWQHRTEEAGRLRLAYEDTILTMMYDFSEHPTLPLTELEVFTGSIVNKTGSQTMRQRDRSRKLHEEFERTSAWITSQMRPTTRPDDGSEEVGNALGWPTWLENRRRVLELCLACVHNQEEEKTAEAEAEVKMGTGTGARQPRPAGRRDDNVVESFWIVAALALIREIDFVNHGPTTNDIDLQLDMAQLAIG